MHYWETFLLGLIQGVAEFLPISSSGHLVVTEALLGGSLENLELNVALHFGTLLSILLVYRNTLFKVFLNPKLFSRIVVATLPVVVVGLSLKEQLEAVSAMPVVAGFGFLVTAALLFTTPKFDSGIKELEQITLWDALVIGLFQAVAPLPGISRSGSTIVGALCMGVKREAATSFSFYIAIPALSGATILTTKDLLEQGSEGTPLPAVLLGTVTAFIVGIFALKGLIKLVAARKLLWFAWYCLVLGLVVITWFSLAG